MRELAARAHAGQLYGGRPYTHHLDAVEAVLRRWGPQGLARELWEDLLVAAQAHDLLEDTATSPAAIEQVGGPGVWRLVQALTDAPGPNRRARHAATYPQLVRVAGAVRVKLADRIANVEASMAEARGTGGTDRVDGARRGAMYVREHATFRQLLGGETPGPGDGPLWAHLDALIAQAHAVAQAIGRARRPLDPTRRAVR